MVREGTEEQEREVKVKENEDQIKALSNVCN